MFSPILLFYNLKICSSFILFQLNWVCDSAWKSTIGQSMFFVGSVFGTQIFGALADNIGRLPVLIFSNVMALIGNGFTIFSRSVPVFSFSRFVSGLAVDSNFLMMYILGRRKHLYLISFESNTNYHIKYSLNSMQNIKLFF